MKRSFLFVLMALVLTLSMGVTGCKKKPKGPTPIPGRAGAPAGAGQGGGLETLQPVPGTGTGGVGETVVPVAQPTAEGTFPLTGVVDPNSMNQDRETLKANTVYFDFDRSAIKGSEQSKLEAVASFLKGDAGAGVWVEGHCDERGTEAYNLSLGERRALAIREYLINLGIAPERVYTISYGEARPADPGHDEGAWAKNRRGDFVVLRAKQ